MRAAVLSAVLGVLGSGWYLSQTAPLPAPFAFATPQDALTAVFPTYSRATGTVSTVRTADGHAPQVGVIDAQPWYANGSRYLALVVEQRPAPGQPGTDGCGACWDRYHVVLLSASGSELKLAARTSELAAPDRSGRFVFPLEVKGDGDVALDLAPYRLNKTEMLLGVRTRLDVIGTGSWGSLQLYRVLGHRLRMVADIDAGAVLYFKRPVQESTIEIVPGSRSYNDIVVVTRNVECSTDRVFSDRNVVVCPPDSKQVGDARYERYRFDGSFYRKVS